MSTHSYTISGAFNPDAFARAAEACEQFVQRQDKADIGGWDGTGDPFFSPTLISFNGHGSHGHQTFQIRRDGRGPTTCDTNHAAYDVVVRGCLLILNEHLGDAIDIDLDDTHPSATELARALVESYIGTMV